MNFDLAQHRYPVLVQEFSILELVEIAMSVFNSHALQEVDAFLSRATCSNANNHTREHCPIIEEIDTARAHAYLDTTISI